MSRKFALDLRQLKGAASITMVASRSPENAEAFRRDLAPEARATSYEEAVMASDVDAVYIATPPALHHPHGLMALAAGKPVLVEKPFAQTAAEAREMAEAAQAAGLFCMEAMWTRFQPLAGAIRELVQRGDLGEIRGFDARFLAANRPDPKASLFDPDRGGGALVHRGIYPLSMAQFWLGPIARHSAFLRRGATGVDEDSLVMLEHESGALTSLRASLRSAGPDGAVIWGSKGRLEIAGPIWRPTGARLRPVTAAGASTGAPRRFEAFRESGPGLRLSRLLARLRGSGSALKAPFAGNGYHYEAAALMAAVAAGQGEEPRMPLGDSVALIELMERLLRADRTEERRP